MKKIRKLTTIVLSVVAMITGNIVFAEYSDVKSDAWYSEYITQAKDMNLVCGYSDGTFRPEEEMTNAEFIKTIVTFDGVQVEHSSDWAESYMDYARACNYVLEGEMTDYNASATRQTIAKVVARVLDLDDVDINSVAKNITDWDTTCPKCKDAISKCYASGILSGYPDGTFRGRYPATRAEVVRILFEITKVRE